MTKLEKRSIDFIIKNKNWFLIIVVTLFGFLIRLYGFSLISSDMEHYLIPWFNEVKSSGGLAALDRQIGDYNLLYQTIISFMTYLKVDCVIIYKLISVLFDYVLAVSTALLVCKFTDKKPFGRTFCLSYTAVLFLPTVILNSAFWGQCDSIYTAFIILMLLQFLNEKYISAFVFFGIALAFKLQAIFILPFIICYYFYKKGFSILNLVISLAVFWASGILAFLNGRSLLAPLQIYSHQTGEYQSLFLNFPSFWALLGNNYERYKTFALIFTLVLCGLLLYCVISGLFTPDSKPKVILLATLSVWTVIMFLPSMHERYSYLLDILLICAPFISIKFLKYSAVGFILSLFTYGNFLVSNKGLDIILVIFYIFAWGGFAYSSFKFARTKV